MNLWQFPVSSRYTSAKITWAPYLFTNREESELDALKPSSIKAVLRCSARRVRLRSYKALSSLRLPCGKAVLSPNCQRDQPLDNAILRLFWLVLCLTVDSYLIWHYMMNCICHRNLDFLFHLSVHTDDKHGLIWYSLLPRSDLCFLSNMQVIFLIQW